MERRGPEEVEGGGEESDKEKEKETQSGEEGDAAAVIVWCCSWRWHLEKMDVGGGVDVIEGFWDRGRKPWETTALEIDV